MDGFPASGVSLEWLLLFSVVMSKKRRMSPRLVSVFRLLLSLLFDGSLRAEQLGGFSCLGAVFDGG